MTNANHQPEQCHVCGVDVSNGWFARIPHGAETILLCSPKCAMRYFDSLSPAEDAAARELAAHEHRLHFLVNGELWS
jgi:hypothetical protein